MYEGLKKKIFYHQQQLNAIFIVPIMKINETSPWNWFLRLKYIKTNGQDIIANQEREWKGTQEPQRKGKDTESFVFCSEMEINPLPSW